MNVNDDIQNLKLVSIIRITNRKLIKEEIKQLRQIALSLKPIILDLQTSRLWKRFRYSKPGTNSHRSCSIKKKMFLEILQNSHENTCRPRASTLLKKGIWHRFFPVNFANFYRPPPGDCFWHGKVNNVFWQVENKKLYTPCFVSKLNIIQIHVCKFWSVNYTKGDATKWKSCFGYYLHLNTRC